jgi:4'-phosphopantetheinyl transferase
MTLQSQEICHWPSCPDRADPHQPTLIRVDVPAQRSAARARLREVLREILPRWSEPGQTPVRLHETTRGPACLGDIGGHPLDLSLSYAGQTGWIGLLLGGWIGVDAMRIQVFAEQDVVARDFLGPSVQAAIRRAADPAQAFALAWTDLEARLKCCKADLVEYPQRNAAALACCQSRGLLVAERLAVTVAWR